MSIEVEIKWVRRDKSKRTFKAKTYKQLLDEIAKRKAKGAKIGDFKYDDFEYNVYADKKTGEIVKVVLSAGYETTLPQWPASKSVDKKEKAAWDKAIKVLAKHEETHRLYHLEAVAKFSQAVVTLEDPDTAKIDKEFEKLKKDHKKEQDAYDTRTDHGVKEGCFLPAPDKL